jgi:hypothetical protein
MSRVPDALDCQPQGDFVNGDRVAKFSDDLEDGEKVHFGVALNWMKRDGNKKNTNRQDLVLFTDSRVLILIRKFTGSNERGVISYDELSDIELKTGITSKKIILSGKNREIVFKITQPGKSECKDAVNFVQNVLDDEDLDRGLSDKSKSIGDHSPIGGYVNQERINKIEDVLDKNENVHYITRGGTMDVEGGSGQSKFGNDRGRKNSLRGYVRAVFTQKRIVVKVPQWLGNDERTIPYRNISSINLDTGLVNKRFTLRASGGTYHIEATEPGKAECRDIISFVREKMRSSQTSVDSASSEKDPLEMLEKLKELHEKGVVSDEEFEEKKEQLMDKI